MYGGLFGDLPSAKKASKGEGESDTKTTAVKQPQVPPDNKTETNTSAVSGLGAVGTSMAFVPTTLRPRKRLKPASNKLKMPTMSVTNIPLVDATTEQPDASSFTQLYKQETSMITKEEEAESVVIENIHSVDGPDRHEPSLQEEVLHLLHSSVTDPYDPHVPNDLLAYRERKALEQERLKLEREARETLERQQRLRQQLEEERRKVEESGSVQDIIAHRTKMMGMGRGRGVSNLPAWLLKKQKEEARLGCSGQVACTRTVILSNLTAPGDIDNDLAHEVKEECEEQCGTVENVEVKDARPPTQPEVQVWVRFQTLDDAKKAEKLFHGRMFGRRRITAKLTADGWRE